MQTHQRIWLFRPNGKMEGKERVLLGSPVIRHFIVVVAVLGLVLVGSGLGARMMRAFAMSPCSSGDQVYSVVSGDTLGGIATRYHTTWQRLASYNHIANPNVIYAHQTVCIQGKARPTRRPTPVSSPIKGTGDYFPYGQCTW